ncbi:response regulator [Epilithonimonas hominis]|uniref:Two-component system, OmpR family, alkaline phosphatase synthesis response regulator PhoP n=1 Tax=Epilithonimonas hominis TaxID=420404 RepID=A0A1H6HWB0_9FLAO|nr:response regulator [Epilithonimonas hominis]SEH38431.1 two-component system, OmpR family, alkaline phosphatase synthesis response regulator PhoP [Epilithonimonas hominis]
MSTSKKIIVVDDSPAILDSVKLMLNMEGFEVSNYERGSDMFNSLLETSTKPDVILMDMWLSGEDGRDICKMIKQHQEFKNIPVVIMSASRGLGDSAIESGAIDFIPKPFDLGEIVEKIRYYSNANE